MSASKLRATQRNERCLPLPILVSVRFGSVGLMFPFCVSPQTDALRGRSGGIGGRREVWVLGQ